MTGFRTGSADDESRRVGQDHERDVHGYHHLMPAPSDSAIVARSDNATVKRARFAFTRNHLWFFK